MPFVRKPGMRYRVKGIRCPDCGPVSVEPDVWEGDAPVSAICGGCGDRIHFSTEPRRDQMEEIGEGEVDPTVLPAWPVGNGVDPYNYSPQASTPPTPTKAETNDDYD